MGTRNKRYIIVGDGAAGFTAARQLRRADPQAQITLVSDDPSPAYFRAALTNYLLGELREEQIWATRPQFYDQHRLQRIHARVIGLDTARAALHLGQHSAPLPYDALLVASGARSRTPNFQGSSLPGVHTLRTLQDCRTIMERIASRQVRQALVIGGGPLALEWALGMHAQGIKVTIVLRGTAFMAGALDAVGSDLLAARLRQAGINLLVNDEIVAAQPAPDGSVGQVTTRQGHTLPCQLIAAAIGVVANTEWLGNALTLGKRRGVLVDERMQTSTTNVFAAGDVIEFQGRSLQLWEPAQAQARVAASNIIGHPAKYEPGVHYMATRLFDLDFASLGKIDDDPQAQLVVDMPQGTGHLNYRKLIIKHGKLVGALMLGRREDKVRSRGRWFKRLMDGNVDVSHVAQQLLSPGFDIQSWYTSAMGSRPAGFTAIDLQPVAGATRIGDAAELKGTQALNLTQLGGLSKALGKGKPPKSGTSLLPPPASANAGATSAMGGFAAVEGALPVDNAAATNALGTQMLAHFNPRISMPRAKDSAAARDAVVEVEGRRIPLTGDLCRVGAEAGSEVQLQGQGIAQVHAHLQQSGADWYLRDLGSASGTWVNNEPVTVPRRLSSGDRVRIGQLTVLFYFVDEEHLARQSVAAAAHSGDAAPRLEVRSGRAVGLNFGLLQSPAIVGSDPSCSIWIDDTTIATKHARLERQGDVWHILSLDPAAGLWVNQRAVAPNALIPLTEGSLVRLGSVLLMYTQTPRAGTLATPSVSADSFEPRDSVPQRSSGTGQRMQAFAAVSSDQVQAVSSSGRPISGHPGSGHPGSGHPGSGQQTPGPQQTQYVPHAGAGQPSAAGSSAPSPAGRRQSLPAMAMPAMSPSGSPSQPQSHPAQAYPPPSTTAVSPTGHPTPAGPPTRLSFLRVEAGPNVGEARPLPDYFIIGHQPNCHWVIPDASVAAQHLELQRFSGAIYVRNLGPQGSARKNGLPLGGQAEPLQPGDRVQMGSSVVMVYEEQR